MISPYFKERAFLSKAIDSDDKVPLYQSSLILEELLRR